MSVAVAGASCVGGRGRSRSLGTEREEKPADGRRRPMASVGVCALGGGGSLLRTSLYVVLSLALASEHGHGLFLMSLLWGEDSEF